VILISNPFNFGDCDFDLKSLFDGFCDFFLGPKSKITRCSKIFKNKIFIIYVLTKITHSLATTLDQLQGDSNCFLGLLLPKLIQLRLKLKRLTENNSLQYCTPLAHELLSGINKRFRSFLDLDVSDVAVKQAILAAVAHPAYKLKWVTPEKRDAVTQLFLDAVVRLTKLQVTSICH